MTLYRCGHSPLDHDPEGKHWECDSPYVPDFPVIVVHLTDEHWQTVCSEDPMPEVNEIYNEVPRYFCPLCQYFARANFESNECPVRREHDCEHPCF